MKEKNMKPKITILKGNCDYLDDELLPEYDLSKMKIRRNPYVQQKGMTVELEPEVSKHFQTPEDENKVAIVTGGIKGIGKSISVKLAECGAKVYAFGRSASDDIPENIHFVACD